MQAMDLSKAALRKERKRNRIPEIDFLRGLAILLMIFDHLCVDLAMLPGILKSVASNYSIIGIEPVRAMAEFGNFCFYEGLPIGGFPLRDAAHILFVGVFVLLSGICCTFSRNNWKRTGILFAFAMIIKLAFFGLGVAIEDPSMYIYFGMLDSLFIAHLLYCIKDHFSKDKWLDLGIGLYFVFLCRLEDEKERVPTERDRYQVGMEWVEVEALRKGDLFPRAIRDNLPALLGAGETIYLGSERER